jgi:hypothetical protein
MKNNQKLLVAKKAKNDEFYTRLVDIQKELDQYDFSELIVGCPADTAKSEFVNYFTNYNRAKKVIYWQDLFNEEMYSQVDVIVTNPPFSIYTDYLTLLAKMNKPFYLVSPLLIHRNSFGLLSYVRSGSNTINHFSNTEKTVPCMWITNFPENRPVFVPEIEHTIYEHNKNGLNVVNRCKDIGKDFKTIANLCLPTTAFLNNYGWDEPLVNYAAARPDVCKSSCLTKNEKTYVIEYRTNVYEYRANDMITDPEKIGKRCCYGMVKLTNYRLEPCDKPYFTRIVINFQPDKIVMYDKDAHKKS